MRSKIATPTVQNTNKKERDGRESRVVGGKEGGWEGDGEHVSSTLIESSASNPPATLGAAGGSIVIEPCMQQTAQKLQLGSWRVDTQQSDACLTVNIPPASCVYVTGNLPRAKSNKGRAWKRAIWSRLCRTASRITTNEVAHQRGSAGHHFWTLSASLPFITAE